MEQTDPLLDIFSGKTCDISLVLVFSCFFVLGDLSQLPRRAVSKLSTETIWTDTIARLPPEITSSQCHKCFTGLYLQVCKTGKLLKSIIAARAVEIIMLMPVFTFENQVP